MDGDPDEGFSLSSVLSASVPFVVPAHECQDAGSTRDLARASMSRDIGVVVDTSTAVWNRTPSRDTTAVEAQVRESEHDNGPVRKKRKSDVGPMSDRTERAAHECFVIGSLKSKTGSKIIVDAPKGKASAARDARDRLRDRLFGIARDGSQVPTIQHLEQGREDAEIRCGYKGS